MDYSLSGSSVHGIFQARKLEWVAISSSRGSSWPRDWTNDSCVSDFGRWTFYHWATWEALYIQTNIWSATVTSECGISGFGVEVSDQGGTFTFYFILVFIFRIVFLAVACPVFLIKKNKDQLKESLTRPDSGLAPLWVLCWLLDAQGRGPGGGFCRTLIMHRIGLQILQPAISPLTDDMKDNWQAFLRRMCRRKTFWGYITFKRDPSQSLLALEQPVLSTWVSSQQTPPPPHLESNHRLECTSIRAQLHCQCNIPRFVNTWPIPESLSREKPEARVWDKGISHSPPSPPQQCCISFLISFDPPATQDEADRPHRRLEKPVAPRPLVAEADMLPRLC